MYVRVKHEQTTFFLQCEPDDTVLELKRKLAPLTSKRAALAAASTT